MILFKIRKQKTKIPSHGGHVMALMAPNKRIKTELTKNQKKLDFRHSMQVGKFMDTM